jgi:hypothetical protein
MLHVACVSLHFLPARNAVDRAPDGALRMLILRTKTARERDVIESMSIATSVFIERLSLAPFSAYRKNNIRRVAARAFLRTGKQSDAER